MAKRTILTLATARETAKRLRAAPDPPRLVRQKQLAKYIENVSPTVQLMIDQGSRRDECLDWLRFNGLNDLAASREI
jgi:hypothetical protein